MCKRKLPGCVLKSATVIREILNDDYIGNIKQPHYKLTEEDFKKIYLLKRLVKNDE
jgi:hypothetical protein